MLRKEANEVTMIEPNRPICAMDDLRKLEYSDPFKDWSKYTLVSSDQEWRQYDEEPDDHDHQWESCNAWWSVKNDSPTSDIDQNYYVRCMEPAVWYVAISNRGIADGSLTFCEFHKPRVQENS